MATRFQKSQSTSGVFPTGLKTVKTATKRVGRKGGAKVRKVGANPTRGKWL